METNRSNQLQKNDQPKSSLWKWVGFLVFGGIVVAGLMWKWLFPLQIQSMELDDGTKIKFRTNGEHLEIYKDQDWHRMFVQGVNLGAALPGYDPGELPITKEMYLEWFRLMAEMGSNVVRIYTIHPPAFYEAIVEYNRSHPEKPLYFIQGVWTPEEQLIETQDAYLPEIRNAFKEEISMAVRAVFGAGEIPESPGKASGNYRVNAAPFLLAWHIGTEWDPLMVNRTNEAHKDLPRYSGKFVRAKEEASPFESWLAEMLDHLAIQEERHGWQHPLTFTNWVTTDPLTHPGEPTFEEDLVSVDATHIETVDWTAGYFATYHVYPYYPDLFRFDKTLRTAKNGKGQIDPYTSYLRRLKQVHEGMPIMVTEFGVPSSLGLGHVDNLGRNQGGHTEKEQGEINRMLFREIVKEGYAGAILFSWQDEWFKRTWNTMQFEIPAERRKLWLNVLTNEEMFGVAGMYPSKDGIIVIDGDGKDWDQLAEEEKPRMDAGQPGIAEIRMTHDEGYVYMLVKLAQPFDPVTQRLHFGFDTLHGGNRHAPELSDAVLDEGLEVLVTLGEEEDSEVRIASNYDFHTRLYGKKYGMLLVREQEMKDDSGIFKPWKLTIGLQMTPPDTKVSHPFEDVVVGKLRRGNTDPEHPDYNSLAMWEANGTTVELRIPWMLLGFTDPSSLQVMSYRDAEKGFVSETTNGIRVLPWIRNKHTGAADLAYKGGKYPVSRLPVYRWKPWETVEHYHFRLKQSYEIMKEAFLENNS